tara:strand:+ start:57 stop:623 length:567 start_codon:yes stop_codon:yes gene_type:complete
MESWRQYLEEDQELTACGDQATTFDEFINGIELATMDPKVREEKIKELKASGDRAKWLDGALLVAGTLSAIPGLQIAGGVAFTAGAIGILGQLWRARQEKSTDGNVDKLLKMLCIDQELLDTIANTVESEYWMSSDIKDDVAEYINRARQNSDSDPMPDFTAHFVGWLNSDPRSPYSKSDDTKVVQSG